MFDILLFLIMVCALAGIVSEILSISVPQKVLVILQSNPEELLHQKFYKFLFGLSGLYILFVVLMLFSGIERFRIYALVIFTMSMAAWIVKSKLRQNSVLLIASSTICMTLLLDVVRTIIVEIF